MKTLIENGSVILPDGLKKTNLLFEDDKILAIGLKRYEADLIIDAKGAFVSPGFIDIHLHGGGGHDFMESTVEAFKSVSEYHLIHGATSQVPTAISAPKASIDQFLSSYRQAMESGLIRARLLGAHLEGPYLSPKKNGAHTLACLHEPIESEYHEWVENYPFVKRMTAAPELEGALKMGDYLHQHHINVSIGHSNAFGNEITEAIAHGYDSVTHLYNAMSSVGEHKGKKAAGIAEMALLNPDLFVEMIADLQHVPKELVQFAYKNKGSDKLILVSDCLSPAGMEAGVYFLGAGADRMQIDVKDAVYLHGQNKLAGSIATVNTLLKNVVSIGIELTEAVKMISSTPAKLLGFDHILGSLEVGKAADILLLDQHLNVVKVICKGEIIR
jgi:N-acetylglucosamine-6-phosphate deacetylase